jgi:hypothetical protein
MLLLLHLRPAPSASQVELGHWSWLLVDLVVVAVA